MSALVLVITNSATGRISLFEGTNQEVLDAVASQRCSLIDFGWNGSKYFALVQRETSAALS